MMVFRRGRSWKEKQGVDVVDGTAEYTSSESNRSAITVFKACSSPRRTSSMPPKLCTVPIRKEESLRTRALCTVPKREESLRTKAVIPKQKEESRTKRTDPPRRSVPPPTLKQVSASNKKKQQSIIRPSAPLTPLPCPKPPPHVRRVSKDIPSITPDTSFSSNEQAPSELSTVRVCNNNVTNDTALLTSLVCLSVLEEQTDIQLVRISSMGKLLLPSLERMVRETLRRNIDLHLCTSNKSDYHDDISIMSDSLPRVDANFLKRMDMSKAEHFARMCLKIGNYNDAIAIYQVVLAKQPSSHLKRTDTLSKLTVLCLAVGRNKQALQYSNEALQIHRQNARPLQAAMSAMEVGMIHFGANKVGQALKSWREAMQLTCLAVGYDHLHVAVLLCNIGVLHYESGDLQASIRALEESLGMLKSVLGHVSDVSVENTLYQIATTMGNLAMAYEKTKEFDKASALLDESISMLGSIEAPVAKEMEQIILSNLSRIAHKRESSALAPDAPKLEWAVSDDESVDSVRSSLLFGNSDGIPDRRVAAKLSLLESDNHDFILLGPLHPQSTPEQRVRETVMTWFGRNIKDDASVPFIAFDDSVDLARDKEAIPVDLDGELVPNAELRLKEIHEQAMNHLDHNEIEDALDLFRIVLRSHQNKYGHSHHLVGTTLHNMGMVHLFAKRYDAAFTAFSSALAVRSSALGPDHPDVQASLMKIGLIRYACKDFTSARRIFCEIRDKFLEVLGYRHPQMAKIMNNLGAVFYEMGDLVEAYKAFEISHEYQKSLSEDKMEESEVLTLAIANSLSNMAFIRYKEKRLLESLILYEEALDLQRRFLDEMDPKLVVIRNNVKYLIRDKGIMTAVEDGGCVKVNPVCLMTFFGSY